MVELKDFKENGVAYLLENAYLGAIREPNIKEVIIQKVGRKYIKALNRAFQKQNDCEYGFISNDVGRSEYLCPTEKDARNILEKKELLMWFNTLSAIKNKLTLEQLRKIKIIAESYEKSITTKEFIKEFSVDEAYLDCWYIDSVSEYDNPVWTEEHISEMYNDFYILPRDIVDKLN